MISFYLFPAGFREINEIIKSLKTNTSPGMDQMHARIFGDSHDCWTYSITNLINSIIDRGFLPDSFSESIVLPIYKGGGDINDMSNYRPITILNSLTKIFDKFLTRRIYSFIEKYGLLHPNQYGFRTNRNTEMALEQIIDTVTKRADTGQVVAILAFDLKKAFDSLNHSILLGKCFSLGLRGNILDLISRFIKDRKQWVRIGDVLSHDMTCTVGIPQGSSLGPLLFNIYFDSVLHNVEEGIVRIAFADDLTIVIANSSREGLEANIRAVYNDVNAWVQAHMLRINTLKTKIMFVNTSVGIMGSQSITTEFSINLDTVIEIVESMRILGVEVDSRLRFDYYVRKLICKLNPLIGGMFRKGHLIDKSLKINIYKNIILNKLNYASRIWIPNVSKTDRKNLKRINKRALKLLNRGASVISTKFRYNLWDIDQLAMYSGIINTKKQIINKNIGYTGLISHRSSSYIKFILPRHSKNFYKKSPTYRPRAIYAFN